MDRHRQQLTQQLMCLLLNVYSNCLYIIVVVDYNVELYYILYLCSVGLRLAVHFVALTVVTLVTKINHVSHNLKTTMTRYSTQPSVIVGVKLSF
jgi:hypothetical protein